MIDGNKRLVAKGVETDHHHLVECESLWGIVANICIPMHSKSQFLILDYLNEYTTHTRPPLPMMPATWKVCTDSVRTADRQITFGPCFCAQSCPHPLSHQFGNCPAKKNFMCAVIKFTFDSIRNSFDGAHAFCLSLFSDSKIENRRMKFVCGIKHLTIAFVIQMSRIMTTV